jgi:hypothetical protein
MAILVPYLHPTAVSVCWNTNIAAETNGRNATIAIKLMTKATYPIVESACTQNLNVYSYLFPQKKRGKRKKGDILKPCGRELLMVLIFIVSLLAYSIHFLFHATQA